MPDIKLNYRECTNPDCRFRFPVPLERLSLHFCPKCGWELKTIQITKSEKKYLPPKSLDNSPVVEALLDNIRSSFNVGSIFRSADGAGLRKLHLCGITPTPENPAIAKTSLGAENSVPWSSYPNAVQTVKEIKQMGFRILALEKCARSCSIFEISNAFKANPMLLIVGNEVSGVDPAVLDLSDKVTWIPMRGTKESLNVSIAFGIAAYILRFSSQSKAD